MSVDERIDMASRLRVLLARAQGDVPPYCALDSTQLCIQGERGNAMLKRGLLAARVQMSCRQLLVRTPAASGGLLREGILADGCHRSRRHGKHGWNGWNGWHGRNGRNGQHGGHGRQGKRMMMRCGA